MAVTELGFSFQTDKPLTIRDAWSHSGVVGSGDMEVLVRRSGNQGRAVFRIETKVKGFDNVWKSVLERFVLNESIGNVEIDINDNAATPPVVVRRLQQAIENAGGLVPV